MILFLLAATVSHAEAPTEVYNLSIQGLDSAPTIKLFAAKSDKEPAFELNTQGLFQGKKLICGWEHGDFKKGKVLPKDCQKNSPIKAIWADGGKGTAIAEFPINKRDETWIEIPHEGKTLFAAKKDLPPNSLYWPSPEAKKITDEAQTKTLLQDKSFLSFREKALKCIAEKNADCLSKFIMGKFYIMGMLKCAEGEVLEERQSAKSVADCILKNPELTAGLSACFTVTKYPELDGRYLTAEPKKSELGRCHFHEHKGTWDIVGFNEGD